LAVKDDIGDVLGGKIREVRDTMGVRVKVAIASVRRGRESNSIGGLDDGRAVRSECTLRVCTCTLRVCTCSRRRKFIDPFERISKHPRVVSKHPSVVGTSKRGGYVVVPCEAILTPPKRNLESGIARKERFRSSPCDEGANARELRGALGTYPLSLRNS